MRFSLQIISLMQYGLGRTEIAAALLVIFLHTTVQAAEQESAPPQRPNFVIILCDDLGYGDLACYGHPVIQTPHLDQMAADGIRLTSCYAAAPICSSSRAGLITGRNPTRLGIYTWISANNPMHLQEGEATIASVLQQAGYETCHVGKWHLTGNFNQKSHPQPDDFGFQHYFSTFNNANRTHENPVNFVKNGQKVGPLEGFSCQIVTDEGIRWLKEDRDESKPFFLYLCFHETHEKVASPNDLKALYSQTQTEGEAIYYANVTNVDNAVGRLLRTLEEMQLSEETLVFFTSDHGPEMTDRYPEAWRSHGSSGPFTGMKRHVYEGGLRVPGILHWKGKIAPGAVVETPVSSMDLLPTFCELADARHPDHRKLDGVSFAPLLSGKSFERDKPLFWHFYAASEGRQFALREGEWKIVAGTDQSPDIDLKPSLEAGTIEQLKKTKLVEFELYHITQDISESHNLAEQEPKRLKELSEKAQRIYREIIEEGPVWSWPESQNQTRKKNRK